MTQVTLKDLINQYVETKNQREALNAESTACTNKMAQIEKDIMEQMAVAGIDKAATDKATVTMKVKRHPAISDWPTFYEYVASTKQFELLHKRLSSPAFRERWDAGEDIPGTSPSEVWELSVVRRK